MSESIRYEPVEAHTLFGGFEGKAAVNLWRDAHYKLA
jgi:hypothetical protein